MRQLTRNAILMVVLWGLAGTARAEFPQDVPDRWQLQIGGMAATLDTEAGLSPAGGGIGAIVVFEDFFNLPIHDQTILFNGSWRMTGRHLLDFGYVDFDRLAGRVIQRDIEWGDYIFPTGVQVEAGIGSEFIYAAYRYDFMHQDQVRISGSFGISYMDLSASLAATGGVLDSNMVSVTGAVKEEGNISLPVPLVGVQIDIAPHRRVALQLFTRFFFIDGFGIRGGVTETAINMT